MKDESWGGFLAVAGMLTLALILNACGEKKNAPPPRGPVEVAVTTIEPREVVMTTELSGRTSASLIAEVRPQVGGIIKKRLFIEGSDVKAGQALFQIDPAMYKTALDNADAALSRSEAQLATMRRKAKRTRELLESKAVSQEAYDDAMAALEQAEADVKYSQANVRSARINLKYTSITAPISGRIGRSNVTEGALVTAHQPTPLATIQQLDPMNVDVTQSTAELLRLRRRMEQGQLDRNGEANNEVRLVLEDGSPYSEPGILKFLDVTVDPTTGSVILRIVFPNPKGILLPGMFIRAVVQEGINKKAILIPQQAVTRDPRGNPLTMLVDDEGKVQQRQLELDRAMGNEWLVSEGLQPGDRIIVEGALKVKPGVSVKTVPYKAEEKDSNAAGKAE